LKYSYSTRWGKELSDHLGNNLLEQALKDYNGQTYWLSFNLKSLLHLEDSFLPDWFSLALGYGADFMSYPYPKEGKPIYRKRQFFMSLDIDLNKINTKSKTLNSVLHTFGFLKFPAPTIQYRNGNIFFHPIYY
jgi:hypothetical protein